MTYAVGRMSIETGTWDILSHHINEQNADDRLDYWWNKYPHAHIEVLSLTNTGSWEVL